VPPLKSYLSWKEGNYEHFSAQDSKPFCPAEQPGKQQQKEERIKYGRGKNRQEMGGAR
jgi:hypothetical protein